MRACLAWIGVGATLIAGCDRKSEIKVYRIAKAPLEESAAPQGDSMPTNAPSPMLPAGMAPMSAGASTAVPANWEPQPPSQMRQASFLVRGPKGEVVDISLVTLGSSASNVLDNVNRWLGQLGQPPVTPEKLGAVTQHLTTSIGDVAIVDLAGLPKDADPMKDGRIIAAMVAGPNGTMFFKMRGSAELTEAQKGDFIKWVAAICNGENSSKPAPMAAAGVPAQDAGAPKLKWKTPEGWTEVPASSMRYASFNAIDPNGGKVDISVVTFPGDGGSDADNVNRWRRQIGLPPVDDKAIGSMVAPLKSANGEFSSLDMTSGDSRVIAAWTRRDGRSWFFKMSGPKPALESEKAKFFDFIRSIDFHS